jgi:hypothetical protein
MADHVMAFQPHDGRDNARHKEVGKQHPKRFPPRRFAAGPI